MSQGQLPAQRRGFSGLLSGMNWWQILLSALPMGLLFVGGLIGGAIGLGGVLTNRLIARSKLDTPVKLVSMIGVVVLCGIIQVAITVAIVAVASR